MVDDDMDGSGDRLDHGLFLDRMAVDLFFLADNFFLDGTHRGRARDLRTRRTSCRHGTALRSGKRYPLVSSKRAKRESRKHTLMRSYCAAHPLLQRSPLRDGADDHCARPAARSKGDATFRGEARQVAVTTTS